MAVVANINNFYDWDVRALEQTIMEAKKQKQTILPIVVNSYGGQVYNCFRMVDMLKASGMKIVTLLIGYAMSAGSIIFAIGDERYMSENSTIMIHEVSSMNWGKNSEMKSYNSHIDELNTRLFDILDTKSNNAKGFFKDLVNKNNNADLFLNAEQAKEYGLANEIRIPTYEEIFHKNIVARSPYENIKILMEYSHIDSKTIKNTNENSTNYLNNIKSEGGKKSMDLTEFIASLSDEQKEVFKTFQASLTQKGDEITALKEKVSSKETEIADLKAAHDKKLAEIEASNDKSFLDGLKANFQLKQADYEEELKVLASFGSNTVAKEAYKKKMSQAQKVVAGAIENHKEEQDFTAKGNDYASKLEVVAKKHGYDLKTVNGLQDAQLKLAESEGK